MLDDAGYHDVRIVASGDLDEWIIHDLKIQGASIDIWGVGTRLVTSHSEPALTGVYKLAAIEEGGAWSPRIKVAERATKATLPGCKQVWRLMDREGWWEADLIAQADEAVTADDPDLIGYHPLVEYESKRYTGLASAEPLLEAVIVDGRPSRELPDLTAIRRRTKEQIAQLHPTSRRLLNPHVYKVSISARTLQIRHELRERLAGG